MSSIQQITQDILDERLEMGDFDEIDEDTDLESVDIETKLTKEEEEEEPKSIMKVFNPKDTFSRVLGSTPQYQKRRSDETKRQFYRRAFMPYIDESIKEIPTYGQRQITNTLKNIKYIIDTNEEFQTKTFLKNLKKNPKKALTNLYNNIDDRNQAREFRRTLRDEELGIDNPQTEELYRPLLRGVDTMVRDAIKIRRRLRRNRDRADV